MDNLFGNNQNNSGFTSYDLTDIDMSKTGAIDFRNVGHGAQVPTHQRGDPLKQNKFIGSKMPSRGSGHNIQQPSPQQTGPSGKGRSTGNAGSRGTASNFFTGNNGQ